jgi:gas vesicle protein GvpN
MVTQKVLRLQPREDFVLTPRIESFCRRAMTYLDAGYACHFRGSAGTGKTTLAMHVAHTRARPVVLMFGDEEFGTSDLVGMEKGVHSTKVTDNFVRSVTKTEEFRRGQWVDNPLTTACKHGYTLVYDEFSRSRPEANNALLSVLEERILSLPEGHNGSSHMRVHPEFRAIFTSNPEDYAGVHKTQNALLDRMITIELDHYDRETEVAITSARAGVDRPMAEKIVDLVRHIRSVDLVRQGKSLVPAQRPALSSASTQRPTLRASIMIARIMRQLGFEVARCLDEPVFLDACLDILHPRALTCDEREWTAARGVIREAITAMN